MELLKVFKKENVKIDTNAVAGKDAVLREIAVLAKANPILATLSEDQVFDALKKREEISSTGFENGVAIPHCRFPGLADFVVGVLVVPDGVNFESMDGKKSRIFFFIIGPEERKDDYIKILSGISLTLDKKGVIEEMVQQTDPEVLAEAFLRHYSFKPVEKPQDDFSLFHIIIQREDKFEELLQAVSSLTSNISVMDAQDAHRYLNAMPLFATFWNSEDKGFNRIIVGMLSRSLTNELVRNLNVITGGMDGKSGIMIGIQDLAYCSGSLSA